MKVFFLDRDGVINVDKGYVHTTKDFIFTKKIFEVLRLIQSKGYKIHIITNQSGIGRGMYSEDQFKHLNKWMLKKINSNGVEISSVSYCPHKEEDNCLCRKPKTKMIDDIVKTYNVNLKASWLVGDKISDMILAKNAGIDNTIFITNENDINLKKIKPKLVMDNLSQLINLKKW